MLPRIALAVLATAGLAAAAWGVLSLGGGGQPAAAATAATDALPYVFTIDEDALGGAPDRSALNQALTAASRITARDGHFWAVGEDLQPGTGDDRRVRLYGVNLSFEANFPDAAEGEMIARRLRRLGFNAVRLHHLDTSPGLATTPPRSVLTPGPYPSFNEEAAERLRGFIRALAGQGLYVNLNLRVGYRFRPREDGVQDYDPATLKRPIAAPILVYDTRMRQLQKQYARGLIQRLGLQGDPALAMVEINNESSLLAAWQRREWGDAVPSAYRPQLEGRWRQWLQQRYGSISAACAAWGDCSGIDATALLAPSDADVPAAAFGEIGEKVAGRARDLAAHAFGRSDPLAGEDDAAGRRVRDFLRFLADTDAEYLEDMAAVVREETDALVPVTGTQMSYGGALNLTSHAHMDYIDEHFYVDHPDFLHGHVDQRDWRIWDLSLSGGQMDRLLRLGFMRDCRKPFVVSEYNHPFPSRQGAEIMPLMAAVAALQDWDGLFFFDYANAATWSTAPANFTLRGDWGKYALTGQSAALFRSGELMPLQSQLSVPLDTDLQLRVAASQDKDALWHHLEARHGIVPAVALRARVAADTGEVADIGKDAATTSTRRDFGYDPQARLFELRSALTWGLFGPAAQRQAGSGGLVAEFPDAGAHHVAVMLSALDGQPVEQSSHLLLSMGSATVGSQPGSNPPRPKRWIRHPSGSGSWTLEPDPDHADRPSASRQATAPAWLAGVPMRLQWPAAGSGVVTVYPLDGSGNRLAPLPVSRVRREEGRIGLELDAAAVTTGPWFEVVLGDAAAPVQIPSATQRSLQ